MQKTFDFRGLLNCKPLFTIAIFNFICFGVAFYLLLSDTLGKNVDPNPKLLIHCLLYLLSVIGLIFKNKVGWFMTSLPLCYFLTFIVIYNMPYRADLFVFFSVVVVILNILFALLNSKNVQKYYRLTMVWLIALDVIALGFGFLLTSYLYDHHFLS